MALLLWPWAVCESLCVDTRGPDTNSAIALGQGAEITPVEKHEVSCLIRTVCCLGGGRRAWFLWSTQPSTCVVPVSSPAALPTDKRHCKASTAATRRA